MDHHRPERPRFQAGRFILRAASLLAPLAVSFAILVPVMRIPPGDWLVALAWMGTHLWMDYQLHCPRRL